MATRKVEYIIQLRDKFSTGMDRLNKRAFQMDNRMKRLDKTSTGLGKTLGRVFAGVAILAGIKKTINAFEEQEFAAAQVRQAIESTGFAARRTLGELTKQAKKLQEETIFGDETILEGVTAQLLRFSNISEDTFDRTQQAVLDMTTRIRGASAGVSNLRAVSLQLGKALDDPIGQLGSLGEVGVFFSKSQKEVIKRLVETNQLAKAQSIILERVERQFKGSAKAARDTALGGLKVLQSRFQDLLVIIGEQFIPLVLSTKDVLKGLIDFLTKNQRAIQILVKATIAAAAAFAAYKTVTFLLTAGIRVYVVAIKLSTIATRFFTKGTKAATTAARIFGVAVKTTPIGLIASLLATAAGAFLIFRDDVEAATGKLTEFGNKLDEISEKAGKRLFEQFIERVELVDPTLTKSFDVTTKRIDALQSVITKLSRSELESLKLFLEKTQGELNRSVENAAEKIKTITDQTAKVFAQVGKFKTEEQFGRISDNLKLVNKELGKFGKQTFGGVGGITQQQVGITKITSAAPKIFNINIEKLVETINNNVTNLKEGMNESKNVITEALLTVLSDVQIQSR